MNIVKKLYRKFFPKKIEINLECLVGWEIVSEQLRLPVARSVCYLESNDISGPCGLYIGEYNIHSVDGYTSIVKQYIPFGTKAYSDSLGGHERTTCHSDYIFKNVKIDSNGKVI